MKKILSVVPILLSIIILLWGFVNINIKNTEVFNSEYIEAIASKKVEGEELEVNTGIDLTSFNKDESIIKIYNEENNLKLVFKNKIINLNEGILGRVVVLTVNSINNALNYINTLIENFI
ncbi:MAG: hypothetical protein Q4B63_00510 [Clostridium perfringens]|nr:hypothetical protein [Clostridium perfringens]